MKRNIRMEKRYGPQCTSDDRFTARARLLQSIYRVRSGETAMGVGPTKNSVDKETNEPVLFGNMLLDGDKTGKNFYFPETFEYAQTRVRERKVVETIDGYRLFNNLLSSMSMTFNIFHPLMMLKEKDPKELDRIIKGVFPDLPVHHVNEILIEHTPTPIRNYINDKTAMDAAIIFTDVENYKYIISFEVKYTGCLGLNEASDKDNKSRIAAETDLFTATGLDQIKNCCPQIYRNFLLTEKYRMVHQLEDSFSVVLAPRDHPSTEKEIRSIKQILKPETRYKIQSYTLEDFMDAIYERCPFEFIHWVDWFSSRYLHFDTVQLVR